MGVPVLQASGWGVVEGSRLREELICPGRIQSGGTRGKGLTCDYVLQYRGQKLAVLEAKRAGISHRDGIGQAKDYAQRLEARFAYASNGIDWHQIDMQTGAEGDLSLQRRLYLYKIDHFFAGDFVNQDGKSFLVDQSVFDSLPQRLDALDTSDRLWVLQHLQPDVETRGPSQTVHPLPCWHDILNKKKRLGMAIQAPKDFDETLYLSANPDVKQAIELGALPSAFEHYITYGRQEGRRRPVDFC